MNAPHVIPGTVMVIGTRAVVTTPSGRWAIVCAGCREGSGREYNTQNQAVHTAAVQSARPCTRKGCGMR